jgi:S1-C subfamily serine protease
MNPHFYRKTIGVISLLALSIAGPIRRDQLSANPIDELPNPTNSFKQTSIAKLQSIAETITVKVQSGQNSGSGIIIDRQGQTYTIVTNQHVLRAGNGPIYPVQTPDDRMYSARVTNSADWTQNDLSVLQFESDRDYAVANLGESAAVTLDEDVFAAGFPFEVEDTLTTAKTPDRGFRFTMGQVSSISDRSFAGGYQIGYTNAIKKGMSGGPVLNQRGEVVAINGMHAHPLWGNPYVFEDGSFASESQFEQMSQLSWAIPIDTLVRLMN